MTIDHLSFWQKLRLSLRVWRAEQHAVAGDTFMSAEWLRHNRPHWFVQRVQQ